MAEYERRCAEMLETATDNAKAAMPPAIDRLRGIIDDDQQQPQQHIAAARAVLEYGLQRPTTLNSACGRWKKGAGNET